MLGLVVVVGTVRVVVRGAVVVGVVVVVVPLLGRVAVGLVVVAGRVVVPEGVTTVRVTVVGRVVVVVVGVALLFPEVLVLAEVTVFGFAVAGLVVVDEGTFTLVGAVEPLVEDPAVKVDGSNLLRVPETSLPEGVTAAGTVVLVLLELPLKLLPPPVVPAIWS